MFIRHQATDINSGKESGEKSNASEPVKSNSSHPLGQQRDHKNENMVVFPNNSLLSGSHIACVYLVCCVMQHHRGMRHLTSHNFKATYIWSLSEYQLQLSASIYSLQQHWLPDGPTADDFLKQNQVASWKMSPIPIPNRNPTIEASGESICLLIGVFKTGWEVTFIEKFPAEWKTSYLKCILFTVYHSHWDSIYTATWCH